MCTQCNLVYTAMNRFQYFAFIFSVSHLHQIFGYTLEIQQILDSENVSSSSGGSESYYTIYNTSQDWFSAFQNCKTVLGHRKLVFGHLGHNAVWNPVKQFLREAAIPENITFWIGYFRPFPHIDRWFQDNCFEKPSLSGRYTSDKGQCLALHLDSHWDAPVLKALDCFQQHQYICADIYGDVKFQLYVNVTVSGLPALVTYTNHVDVNLTECIHLCEKTYFTPCVGIIFSYDDNNCTIMLIPAHYGRVEYTITPSTDHVTHGLRKAMNVTFSNVQPAPVDSSSYIFPDCGISPVPEDYCEVPAMDISQQYLQEIVQNLTIDPMKTSMALRLLTSAPDDRTSAILLGVVGVIVCLSVLCVPVLIDGMTLMRYFIVRKNRGKKSTDSGVKTDQADEGITR